MAEMPGLRWLTNLGDPWRQGARRMCSGEPYVDLTKHVIGEPKATAHYTSEQLAAMGLVGLYAVKEEAENDGSS